MPSVVDICNMALSRIGNSQRIDDLTEASIQAEQCSLFYEASRDFVLRDFAWGFATTYAQLAEVSINPTPMFPFSYAVPTDCLKARQIVNTTFPEGEWPPCSYVERPIIPPIPFRIINGGSGRLIATQVSPATLEYTARIESPEMFDPIFVSALAWKLASNIAPAIARDANVAQACESAYQAQIASAIAADLNESAPGPQADSSFITGRN
ncbi:hypothetical protein BK645_09910 [Pseudomonas protegens]|uniref:hypothetical protein n=1 Tax=Pseudomonas protegens TaxID=380021 RepID=UPI000381BC7A|nr:hypothetical protein [Pseudomonas protegens]ROM29275.1 hypothetical protein BK645_09910 [Pseudomonas protegens]ROM36907.1 hypothetical protein BK646_17950 [Pseudomonas protegens]